MYDDEFDFTLKPSLEYPLKSNSLLEHRYKL